MSTPPVGTVLGIVLIARHGDRSGFFQDPNTYTASDTHITPWGLQQEHDLGDLVRRTYLVPGSSRHISDIRTIADGRQIKVRADTGDEGGVIFNSAVAFLQGLYPPNAEGQSITLANGTSVVSPMGGYQYVPIETAESTNDVSLEGFAMCTSWNQRVQKLYNSTLFAEKGQEAAQFLAAVKPYMDRRNATIQNMYNVYDFLNVQSLHNATFLDILPDTLLEQARGFANWHEWVIFSDSEKGGIGNVAGASMIPSLLDGVKRIANPFDPLKIHYSAISYKPFISLFNMTGTFATDRNDSVTGIVSYASSLVFEVVQGNGGVDIRMRFKNGTDDADYGDARGGILDSNGVVSVDSFTKALQPYGINSTREWCNFCNNRVDRGCAAYFSNDSSTIHDSSCGKVSNAAAGVIGAAVTLAVILGALGALFLLGCLKVGRKRKNGSVRSVSDAEK